MEKVSFSFKKQVIQDLLKGKIDKDQAAKQLKCTRQTINLYLRKVAQGGLESLRDRRRSNFEKLTSKQILDLCQKKKNGPWRSARKVKELLNLPVGPRQIQYIWAEHGLNRLNIERLKPITRFVAPFPNDLWQADIMGKINFPLIGNCYLIANIDDHSRFILGGKWFKRQHKINVFRVWYHCLYRWGLPKAMLQDKGSQYRSSHPKGQADYQFYAQILKINLIFAKRAQTKGKIERLWRFIQQDFVRENLDVKSISELNKRLFAWQKKYNQTFKSSGLGMDGRTPAEVYQPSKRRKPAYQLREMLIITERRYVYRDSTISLFGRRYRVPYGYIGCRVWVKIIGDKVIFEAMGKIICKQRLKI